ncbi:MAG: FAD-dependent oxidoreductase [Pigmentiphaga sp.]|nr:FAD-dependent oxidoreductase [Pigmentiphaga sp.]
MQPGRRAFLMPKLGVDSPWEQFCQRLGRVVRGTLRVEDPVPGQGHRATLTVARDEDVMHALVLTKAQGVLLSLPGCPPERLPLQRDVLMLDDSALQRVVSLDAARGILCVEPGCTTAALEAMLAETAWRLPWTGEDAMTAGDAAQSAYAWPTGHCPESQLYMADVLLAEGCWEVFGPFGVSSSYALRTAAGRRIVSGSFELSAGKEAQTLLAQPAWSARLRLDGLTPRIGFDRAEQAPNAAHLLLGSEGRLAWVSRYTWLLSPRDAAAPRRWPARVHFTDDGRERAEDRLDLYLKMLFDPEGVFPPLVV